MKRKNVIRLLTVMIAMLVVVPVAFGSGSRSQITCDPACNKCPVAPVPCPETIQGPQGSTSVTSLSPFDFEGKPAQGSFGATGYVPGYNYSDNNERDCKFVFDVCHCNEACDVRPGTKVGIQMVIKTPGVYFADPSMTTVYFDIDEDQNNFCKVDTQAHPTVTTMSSADVYYNADGERIGYRPTPAQIEQGARIESAIRNFGTVKYYRKYTEGVNSKGYFITTVTDEGAPLSGSRIGAIPDANKVVALQSLMESDYMFTDEDSEGHCYLWIDIPAMRIDPTIAVDGDNIDVLVRLLFNREFEGICEDCNPPDVCECIRTIGKVCPGDTPAPGDTYCMLFPYVLQNLNPWWSGVVVMARDDELPTDAYFELVAKDQDGNMGTYRVTTPTPIWTSVIDSVIPQFTMTKGTMFKPGALSLKVTANYSIHGYSFLTDNNFGAGTLATGCTSGKCAP